MASVDYGFEYSLPLEGLAIILALELAIQVR